MKLMKKILKTALTAGLSALMLFPVPIYAAEGTEGTEIHVLQPEQLEIQLGSAWAGVEFEFKTDSGVYPAAIPVDSDGVLRLEIGGSSSYILTCLNSAVSAPAPTQAPAGTQPSYENISKPSAAEDTTTDMDASKAVPNAIDESGERTVAGIPVLHLELFGVGMVLAIGCLVLITIRKRQVEALSDYEDDDSDE